MVQRDTQVALALVGQDGAGKTSLLTRFIAGKLPGDDNCPTIPSLEPVSKETLVKDGQENVELNCWDTDNCEKIGNVQYHYERLSHLAYPMADVILVVTPINADRDTFREAKDCWWPDMRRFLAGVPVMLVGSKIDFQSQRAFSFEEGQQIAEKIGAVKYMECSALSGDGVDEVFEEAAKVGLQYQKSWYTVPRIKLVITGRYGMGKTCLLIRYNTRVFPQTYIPQTFDNVYRMLQVDQERITVAFWDIESGEDIERLRPLSYPDTDVFLLVNQVISDKDEFDEIKDYWWPELSHHCPGVPVILVGSKVDRRDANSISFKEGKRMAKKIGAVKYMECSALEGTGVDEIFEEAIRVGYEYQKNMGHKKKKSCFCL